jgi:hypothetical protein
VPGSHKSEFDPPVDEQGLDASRSGVVQVPQPAGSALIFTEALRHGTLPWRGPYERRTLFYRYTPGSMVWLGEYPPLPEAPDITPELRRLFERPYYTLHKKQRQNVFQQE